jgi:hypothetical protein
LDDDPHDRNLYNHTPDDTYEHINHNYVFEQVKATTAFAGVLAEPIAFEHKIRLPLIWGYKY